MEPGKTRHWILVCGGFHERGGMDRANAAFARYLLARGESVHLVAHDVDPDLAASRGVCVRTVPRPAGSAFGGELALARAARTLANTLGDIHSGVRIVGNGGNCLAPDVCWVHSVHHAWPCADEGAPAWFRLKNRVYKTWARSRERRAMASARVVIANSDRTRRDVVTTLGVDERRVQTIYLGSDPSWRPPTPAERDEARRRWCTDTQAPLVVFIGALGHDVNKGIDRMLDGWAVLHGAGWTGELVVAGGGDARRWRARAAGSPVRFVGHTMEIGDLLAAADLLVSPVRYEAYGLAVHEAVCRGVPVIVSRDAGVVERLPASLEPLLLPPMPTAADVVSRVRLWHQHPGAWSATTAAAGTALRAHTDDRMAAQMIEAIEAGA